MEREGAQTTPQSLSMITLLWRSLRFSSTFSIAGLCRIATYNGCFWLTFSLSILRKEIPIDEWCKLLVISSKLDCEEMRARAIDELTAKKTNVSSVDRIELGNKYNIPQWLPEEYADAFTRESHLTMEEGGKLGLEIEAKVLQG